MKIAVGADHRGLTLKSRLVALLQQQGHDISDEGTHTSESVDYPDFAALVASKVASGDVQRGILICGTGIGMQIAANKYPHVRAAVCHDELEAEMSRRHNDTNVLCLPGHLVGERRVDQLVSTWMATEFEGGRHARRIEKISQIEQEARHEK
jgi:ribose 5-phosphate isomerase B